jgi:hypothetical protein
MAILPHLVQALLGFHIGSLLDEHIVALGQDVAFPLVRSGIFNLHPTAALDLVAELEQRDIKLRSTTWTGDGHRSTPP